MRLNYETIIRGKKRLFIKYKNMIHIKKDDIAPESTELLAKSIIEVANASQQLLNGGITKRAIAVLLRDGIGVSKITMKQIYLVLDNLPRLKAWYCTKKD